MRIGLSTSVIQRGKTGVGQYVLALVRALLPHAPQHPLTLFVLEEDLPLFQFAQGSARLVSVPETARPPVKNILWHQSRLPGLVKREHIELLHIPSYRRMLWRRPCTLVATVHDLAPFHVSEKYDWRRMFYGRVVARWLAQRQDLIISVSENTARDITRFFGFPRDRLRVVHNGLEHHRFFPGARDEAKSLIARKFGPSRPFFLYVARLEHPAKNHLRLLAAFEEFKAATQSDWQLVFAGSDWHGAEIIHRARRQSRFAEDILSLGFVADAELPDLYRAADVFVYPSLYEGFGLPPLEAMACGCPVMASSCGSLGEVLGEAAVVIQPEDIHSITKQLYLLATGAALRNRLRAAGMAQARKFDWDRTAAETVQAFELALGRSTAPSQALPALVQPR